MQCDECRITETQEKQFLLHSVPVDIVPKHAEEIDNNIKIIWPDGHESFIPIDLIKIHIYRAIQINANGQRDFSLEKYSWTNF